MTERPPRGSLPPRGVGKLIAEAQLGSEGALGQLLNLYRPFLLAVAAAQFDSDLKAKAGPSDVVQETFIEAQRDFARFKSTSEDELRTWLHTILMNNLADLRKRYLRTAKRQVRRERPLALSDSKQLLRELVDGDAKSGARGAISREELARLEAALAGLSPAYRQIIILRSQERRPFAEIAEMIGRSPSAARMLWNRAMLRLKRELGADDGHT